MLTCAAGDFAILNLRVVEGEGTVYAVGSRATRGITVEVTDETGKAVPDVTVSFRLPEDGATGTFSTGSRTEVLTTRQDGRAAIWGMKWNRTPGAVQVRITAIKEGVRAGLVSTQHLSDITAAAGSPKSPGGGGGISKILLIAIAVAGAGGGLALGMSRGGTPTQPAAVAPVALSIGIPSVIVGAP